MSVRRFEFIQGNQAKFWEVNRRGETLSIRSGRIGENPEVKSKTHEDFMAAEREFDRLIRDKLQRGFVEVDPEQPSEPEPPMPRRWLELRSLEGDATLDLDPAATEYIVWRMVEVGVMDKQLQPPDTQRWLYRTARRLGLEGVPDEDDPKEEEFWDMYLDLSKADRRQETRQHGVVGAYKLAAWTDWIVTAREANWIAEGAMARAPRRHKPSAAQRQILAEWIEFNELAAQQGGYSVDCTDEEDG